MRKKWMIGLLIGSMVLSFTGCGKSDTGESVTAESLLDMVEDYKDETIFANAVYEYDLETSVSEDSSETGSLKMLVNLAMQADPKTSYVNGNMTINISGREDNLPMQQYDVKEDDGSVTSYELNDGVWVKEENSSTSYNLSLSSFGTSQNDSDKDLTLDESDEEYIVTSNLNLREMSEKLPGGSQSLSGNIEFDDSSIIKITYKFDKSTKRLKEILYDLTEAYSSAMEKQNIKVNKLITRQTITSYSSDPVEIPENVIVNAVESAPDETK